MIALSLKGLRPDGVSLRYEFEVRDEALIYHSPQIDGSVIQRYFPKEIDCMLAAGIITLAAFAWFFSVVNATKEDEKTRPCVDYCVLNSRMKGDRFLLLKIEGNFRQTKERKDLYKIIFIFRVLEGEVEKNICEV